MLVGEGGVGKTALLRALLGEKFVENLPTTHGIEVERKTLELNHPNLPGARSNSTPGTSAARKCTGSRTSSSSAAGTCTCCPEPVPGCRAV